MYGQCLALLMPAEDGRDNTGSAWSGTNRCFRRVPVLAWPDAEDPYPPSPSCTDTRPKAAHSSKEYHSIVALL